MFVFQSTSFPGVKGSLAKLLYQQQALHVGEWHAQKEDNGFLEINGISFEAHVPDNIKQLQKQVEPNLPWAEDHFQERISGTPLNPPPSSEYWPFAQKNNATHKIQEKFSHTYPERFWPKHAGTTNIYRNNRGVRYAYGDLLDVVSLLTRSPLTRQAYLPVWFPEDTGAVDGQRVPCTLGYHFMIRDERLSCTYMIRSCDFMRHFTDDVYMAGRLMQWMCERINTMTMQFKGNPLSLSPGTLTMHIMNLHAFESDRFQLDVMARNWSVRLNGVTDGHVED